MNIKRPDLYRTEQFNKWFNNLKDHVAKSAIRTRLTRMASGHFGGVSGFLCLGRLFQGQPNEAALCI